MNTSAFLGLAIFIVVVLTIAGMIFLYRKIIPQKYDGTFENRFFQELHNYFNFKKLYIEEVLKFLFTLLNVACAAYGVATIITSFFTFFKLFGEMFDGYMTFGQLMGILFSGILGGVLIIVVGVIVLRLIYEGSLMFILLVKNVIEINKKTK